MVKACKHINLVFALLLLSFTLAAQAPYVVCKVSKNQVVLGERFQVSFEMNGTPTKFTAPTMEGFQVLSGPNRSTSMNIVNGQMSQSATFSYIVLPTREGNIRIGAAQAEINGQIVNSQAVDVSVLSPTQAQQQQQQQIKQQQQQESNEIKDNLFLRLNLTRSKAYVGQPIVATYKIYTRLNIVANEMDKLPSFSGFYSQDVSLPQPAQLQQENLNGIIFNSAILKQSVIIPQIAGKQELDPMVMNVTVRIKENRRPTNIFESMWGTHRDVATSIYSPNTTIEVLPLPTQGKPSFFSGAVGNFSISSSVNLDSIKANDAINFKVELKGNGNIKLVDLPEIKFPSDFEVYDPKLNEKISVSSSGISGSKVFEYLIIPRHAGRFTIPAIEFAYFDPATEKYITLKTKPIDIAVGRGEGDNSPATYTAVNKEEIKQLGKDIRFIKTSTKLKNKDEFLFGTGLYYGLLAFPFFLLLLLIPLKRQAEKNALDTKGMKSKRASGIAKKHLKMARKHLESGNKNEFYDELLRALNDYLANKFSIPVAELSRDRIALELNRRSINESTTKKLFEVLDYSEMARYAPLSNTSEKNLLEEAESVIKSIEV